MKHGRPPEEVEQLAIQLADTRKRGEALSLWLEKHAHGLQEMVRAGWTWAQLAEALNAAGITYQAGVRVPFGGTSRGAWTVKQLPRAVQKARRRIEAREAARQALFAPMSQASAGGRKVAQAGQDEQRQERLPIYGLEPEKPQPEVNEMQRRSDALAAQTKAVLGDWRRQREGKS